MNRGVIVFAVVVLGGCCPASTSVLPKDGNTAQVVSTSSKEQCAMEHAQEEAEEYCKKQGKKFYANSSDTKYQGADPNAKLAVGVLSKGRNNLNSSDDYRVEIDFRCE